MKYRKLLTTVLLLFVASSVAYLALTVGPGVQTAPPTEPVAADADAPGTHKVIVYYFHGNARCVTCRTIEAYAEESVRQGFPDAIADGSLQWHAVNVEEPQNRHFIRDFQLATRTVVVAEIDDETRARFKRLDKVWMLVRDEDAFAAYVRGEVAEYLGDTR